MSNQNFCRAATEKVAFSLTVLTVNGLVQVAMYKVGNPCSISTLSIKDDSDCTNARNF